MAFQRYVSIDDKKYAVMHDGYEPIIDRQRIYEEGLTGKSIIQDFTVSSRNPEQWLFRLKVYIDSPWPDTTWGNFADLRIAYEQPYVTMVEHDDTISHLVGMPGQLPRLPRVAANISGVCYGVFYTNVFLKKVYT